jgi:hypothetical protein
MDLDNLLTVGLVVLWFADYGYIFVTRRRARNRGDATQGSTQSTYRQVTDAGSTPPFNGLGTGAWLPAVFVVTAEGVEFADHRFSRNQVRRAVQYVPQQALIRAVAQCVLRVWTTQSTYDIALPHQWLLKHVLPFRVEVSTVKVGNRRARRLALIIVIGMLLIMMLWRRFYG